MQNRSPRLARSIQTLSALLGALVIGACGSSTSTTTGTHHAASRRASVTSPQTVPLPCAGTRLALTFVGTQGATGHLEATFALSNASGTMCTLRGYPGARLLDAAGHIIAMHLKRGGGFFPDTISPPRRVVLAPSASARFGLSFVTNNEYADARRCVVATALESAPPGGTGTLRVALTGAGRPRITPCGNQLVISPVYTG